MYRAALLAVLAGLAPASAWANSTGISGYSGKTTAYCNACHQPSQATMLLYGPGLVTPGAKSTWYVQTGYLAILNGTHGLDVSASGGTFAVNPGEASTKILNGELVHSAPKPIATWFVFDWIAPATPGSYTLYAGGLTANNNKATTGDASGYATRAVTVGPCQTDSQCNDLSPCTTDKCDPTTKLCTFAQLSGCCRPMVPADCDDNNTCTTDTCTAGANTCSHAPVAGCCSKDQDCTDNNLCTADTCNLATHACIHTAIPDCCMSATAPCNDGNKCTQDTCDATAHTCVYSPIPSCCNANSDCIDNNPCTKDTCTVATGSCVNAMVAGCCSSAAQCDDKNPCTTDACGTTNTCTHTPIANCCTSDTQCDDKNPCTTDSCSPFAAQCVHTPITGCKLPDAGLPDSTVAKDGKPPVADGKPPVADGKLPAGDGPQPAADTKPPAGDGPAPPISKEGCCRIGHAGTADLPFFVLLGLVLLLGLRRRSARP